MKIGVLSDTHAYLYPKIIDFFSECDEIWHCGDIGNITVFNQLKEFKTLRAVYGNIDGSDIRNQCKEIEVFNVEKLKVCMTHIGGYPPRYNTNTLHLLKKHQPDIFLCGHSHILRVMYDEVHQLLYINPGAAGLEGFHKKITFLRFNIFEANISDLEVYEIEKNILR
ncbi:MAG TPA: metallophosphoesterase family protein [Bacteroidales bacterium]|jgi:hypothetical protein|nr:metallophosphoesterase family protein [Bacteroidales bacterium]